MGLYCLPRYTKAQISPRAPVQPRPAPSQRIEFGTCTLLQLIRLGFTMYAAETEHGEGRQRRTAQHRVPVVLQEAAQDFLERRARLVAGLSTACIPKWP